MISARVIASLCALLPVGSMALYLGYFADFSGNLKPLTASEFDQISGCYAWRDYKILAESASLKFYHGKDMTAQSPAAYQNSKDVRVMSDIRLQLNPRNATIQALHEPNSQTYIHTSRLFSKPYFMVFDPIPSSDKFVEFEKSAC